MLFSASQRLVLLIGCVSLVLCGQSTRLLDLNISGIIDRAIILPPEQFTKEKVEELARQVLAIEKGKYILLRLTVGVSAADVARSMHQGGAIHGIETYEDTIQRLRKDGFPSQPIARLIATSEGAVLSYHDRSGLFEKILKGRSNPTKLRAGSVEYTLLHFYVSPITTKSGKRSAALQVYFKSSVLSVSGCAELARLLKARIGAEMTTVAIKSSVWFIGSANYPDVYRFEDNLTLPSLMEGKYAPYVSCTIDSAGITCSGERFKL